MSKIYVTSDLHIGHDRDFILEDRGFKCIEDYDRALVENWNSIIEEDDDVYVLGDLMLRDVEHGLEVLSMLKGKLHVIRGNHDTDEKIKRYAMCSNVVELVDAKYLRVGSITLYLSHYPTLVSHENLKKMKHALVNLFGHTHQKENFFILNGEPQPYMYHVGLDSHNMFPVLLDDVIEEVRNQKNDYDGKHQ